MNGRTLIVGTRGSALALWQARLVRASLPGPSEEHVVRTSGDMFADRPLADSSNVGFFTKEIEECLLGCRIDLAVHSLKDLPTALAPGLTIAAHLAREAPGDVLLVKRELVDESRPIPLADGARVGASSLRRQALLGLYSPATVPKPIRGNVPTRVAKAVSGEVDGLILARAGLSRLRLDVSPLAAFDLNPTRWVGAPGQGVIVVETRADDRDAVARVATLDDPDARDAAQAEREQLSLYGGGCHAPFGAFARKIEGLGCELFVASPTAAGFAITRFPGPDFEAACAAAREWQAAGRPARVALEEEAWLSRPARPWC
ncbi:MAG: hydroxymethylbilane synthase [Deltaproteobacteria bacterium]|nr:hydroxymethylbilane synthase [Deltaproteobacteria bacterium]